MCETESSWFSPSSKTAIFMFLYNAALIGPATKKLIRWGTMICCSVRGRLTLHLSGFFWIKFQPRLMNCEENRSLYPKIANNFPLIQGVCRIFLVTLKDFDQRRNRVSKSYVSLDNLEKKKELMVKKVMSGKLSCPGEVWCLYYGCDLLKK